MKKFKKIIAGVGAFALAFTITAPSLISASAETKKYSLTQEETSGFNYGIPNYKDYTRYDENFEFSQDVTVQSVKDDGSAVLRFPLAIKNKNFIKDTGNDSWTMQFVFTIVRDSAEGVVPLCDYVMLSSKLEVGAPSRLDSTIVYSRLNKEVSLATGTSLAGKVSISPNQAEGSKRSYVFEDDGIRYNGKFYDKTSDFYRNLDGDVKDIDTRFGAEPVAYFVRESEYMLKMDNSGFLPTIYIDVPVMSMNANYFVALTTYTIEKGESYTTGALWWKETKNKIDSTISYNRSPSVNVKETLEDMQESGNLETVIPEEEKNNAENIIQNTETKEVTISYLEQIGRTPFATRIEKKVNIPLLNDEINYDDVCVALGKKSLTCLGAAWKSFTKDTFDVYTVNYHTSVHLQVYQDDEGHYAEKYFKLESSFEDFIADIEATEVFKEGTFDFALNEIKVNYPSIQEYEADEIYGLWGYIVVPETKKWTDLFENLLKVPDDFQGFIKHYEAKGKLQQAEYQKILQDEYNYTWNQSFNRTFWTYIFGNGDSIDGVDCTHYVFFADPKIAEASIDTSTSTKVEVTTNEIAEAIKNAFQLFDDTDTSINAVTELVRSILLICGVSLGTVGVVAIVFFVNNVKSGKKKK